MNVNKMNRGKALAAAMAMVMVFACVAVVMSDNGVDAADDTTYLSGQITSSQNFGAGTNVVVNGNLTIPENMTLQIGGKLTVTEGFDLTVNNGGTLIINNGAAAIFDGNLVLKSGAVFQNGAITDTTNKKLGSPLGLYINGGMTVEKGAYIIGAPVTSGTAPGSTASGITVIPGAGTNGENGVGTISGINSVTADGVTTLYPTGNVIEHMNAEGTMGYWIGIRIANAGTAGENSQLKYDGRASVPAVIFGSDKSLDVWINASAKTQTITFVNDDGTQTYVIDCSYVKLGESTITTNPGQIVIGADATFKSNSTKTSPSAIADQTIYLVDGASADVDSILNNVTISAYAASGIYTYGSVTITNSDADAIAVNAGKVTIGTDAVIQSLDFSVASEKISAFLGTDVASAKATSKAVALKLDVSGTIESGYTLTVDSNKALAGANNNLYFPDPSDSKKAVDVLINGTVTINGTLTVGSNGTVTIESGANVEIPETGKITDAGKKGDASTVANFNIYGNIYVAGNVTLGSTTTTDSVSTDNVVKLKLKDTDNGTGAYITIVGDGVVSIKDYDVEKGFTNAPAGTYGATYINSDDAFIITSLSKAIADAVADDVSEITVYGIDATTNSTGQLIVPSPYIIDADLTIPASIELVVFNSLLVSKGVTLTIDAYAEVSSNGTNGGLIIVDGTVMDYTMEEREYEDAITNPGLYVDGEVRFVDDAETYYMYTTLASALKGTPGTIDLFGDVDIENNVTIPEGFTIDLNGKTMTVKADAVLTVDGVIDARTTSSSLTIDAKGTGNEAGSVVLNNMIVNPTAIANNSGTTIPGFIAEGTIGDYESATFLLAPATAATNSATLTGITTQGEVSYNGTLTFTVGEDNEGEVITIASETTIGKIVLSGFGLQINTGVEFTGTVEATVTAGTSSVAFDKAAGYTVAIAVDESGDASVSTMELRQTDAATMAGKVTISAGTVELAIDATFGGSKDDVLVVASGATLVVPETFGITVADMPGTTADKDKYAAVTVDGTLTIEDGAEFKYNTGAKVIVKINGTMNVAENVTLKGDFYVDGTLSVMKTEEYEGKVTVDGTMYVTGTVTGVVDFTNNSTTAVVLAYAGASVDTANLSIVDGQSTADAMEVYVNGDLFMTVYGLENVNIQDAVKKGNVKLTGYDTITWATAAGDAKATPWYTDAGYQNKIDIFNETISDTSAIYVKLNPLAGKVNISVGPQMTVFVDGVKINSTGFLTGTQAFVGDHKIEVTVNPGYTGNVTITFNGQTIQNGGTFTITPEMADAAADPVVLSVTGELSYDTGSTDNGGMGLTEILLIILVILIVVMAIMVALRLMRS